MIKELIKNGAKVDIYIDERNIFIAEAREVGDEEYSKTVIDFLVTAGAIETIE